MAQNPKPQPYSQVITATDPDELKKAVEELTTASHKIAEEMYKTGETGAEAQQPGAETGETEEAPKDKEDVVEAEFEESDQEKKE